MDFDRREPDSQFSHIDLLTGCFNLVSFTKVIEANFGTILLQPITLLGIDVHQLRRVNRTRGYDHGDQVLRWLGIALRDEMGSAVYRISGEEFVVVVTGDSPADHEQQAAQLFERLNSQAQQLDMEMPVVRMGVIHFPPLQPLSTALVWKNLNEIMTQVNADQPFQVFTAVPLRSDDHETVRVIELMVERIVSLGYNLNYTMRLAYTDPVGKLPNMIATQRKLELTLAEAVTVQRPFSVFLIDGDDLKRYNQISYAAGDEMILQLSMVLMGALRPGDFVGRWRFGDEFVVILPGADVADALQLAEGVRLAVQRASGKWLFPTTISLGVVQYPFHGRNLEELISRAEAALGAAKAAGKNCARAAP